MDECEPHHRQFRNQSDHFWGLWNNYQDLRDALKAANTQRGRDTVWRDAESTWGSPYFVPMAFGTIETILPAMVANRPKMLALARDRAGEANADNMQFLIDAQQQQIGYELVLHTIAKDAVVTGIGVQKIRWDKKYRRRTRLIPSMAPATMNPTGYAESTALELTFDDPIAEAIDPNDFFWDPNAASVPNAAYLVHRAWVPMSYIEEKRASGEWRNLEDLALIEGLTDSTRYNEAWANRLDQLGYSNFQMRGANRRHELLEFHVGGDEVFTILDREICVQSGPNPDWHGEYPFDVFSPTEIPHRIEGKSEIAPIQDLQAEINDLRRDRRDNARMILHKIIAYQDGFVEPDDLKWGPAMAWPVTGDPKESLFPIPMQDIPYSGYQEEDRLKGDFQWTTGLSDPTDPGSVQQTATGAQIVAAAVSRRIANKTRRMELQIMAPGTCKFAYLNQQHIIENRDVRIPSPPQPGQPDRRWAWRQLGPAELAGEFAFYPEGGSVPAENVPQNRSDARQFQEMFGQDQQIRQDTLKKEQLRLMGIRNPEEWIAPPEPRVPPAALDILANNFHIEGVDPKTGERLPADKVIPLALDQAMQEEGGLGPRTDGGGGPPSQNGAAPVMPAGA